MVRQVFSMILIYIHIFLVLFDEAECKSGGGHYSSQRTLNSGPSGGHGFSGNSFQPSSMHWSNNPWFSSDLDGWYDYGT